MGKLTILGAVYGLADVTAQVRGMVQSDQLFVAATDDAFGDTFHNQRKTLLVVYQYDTQPPQVLTLAEGTDAQIMDNHQPAAGTPAPDGQLTILGASYATSDVTAQIRGMVSNNVLNVTVNDATFGNPWPGDESVKTLVVVYQIHGVPLVKIVPQGLQLTIAPLTILGASYGPKDVTATVAAQVTPDQHLAFGVAQAFGQSGQSTVRIPVPAGIASAKTTSQPTSILSDGAWHHIAAVRSDVTLSLYLDGVLQLSLGEQTIRSGKIGVGAPATLCIGSQAMMNLPMSVPLFTFPFNLFTGRIDEVRFWNVALDQAAIQDSMHHLLTGSESGLVAHWTFNDQSLADSSPTGTTLQTSGNVTFVLSDLDIEPEGMPYLVTQAQLMQDYVADPMQPGQFTEISGYRVLVAARDEHGNPFPCTLTLWASDAEAPAQIHFFDGSSAVISDQTPTSRRTNALGELSFVIDSANPGGQPADNPLICPMIKVNASFMEAGHRLAISPDRHVHATLSTLTGPQLTGAAPLPSGKTAPLITGTTHSATEIDAAAQAISHVMSAATDHNVQPDRPVTRKRSSPIDTPLPQPYTPVFENVRSVPAPYDFASNAIATHFLAVDQPLTRVVVPENMLNAHFVYDQSGGQFTPLGGDQVNAQIAQWHITPADDFAALFNNQITTTTTLENLIQLAQNEASSGGLQKRGLGDFFDSLKSAAKMIIASGEVVLQGAAQTVKALVVYAVDAVNNAVSKIIETVEDAVHCVGALLAKFGVVVADVVNFVKELFNWDDILQSQRVIEAALQQMPALVKAGIDALQGSVNAKLTAAQNAITAHFDEWIDGLEGQSFNSQTAASKSGPPQDLQTKYLASCYADNAGSASDSANTIAIDSSFSSQLAQTWDQQFHAATMTNLQQSAGNSGVAAFFKSADALSGALLPQLLSLLKQALVDLIGLVNSAANALFSALKAVVDEAYRLCTTRIVIPFLTDFYEKKVVPGDQLTLLSLVSLTAAIPLTATYKLVTGQQGPVFSDAELAQVRDPNWSGYAQIGSGLQGTQSSAAAVDEGHSITTRNAAATTLTKVGWGMSFAYALSTAFWGVGCALEDMGDNSKLVIGLKIGAQIAANLTSMPYFTMPAGSPASVVEVNRGIYFGGLVALGSNMNAAYEPVAYGAAIDPLVTGLYGVGQLAGYLYMDIAQRQWLAIGLGVGESMEWIPQLAKIAALFVTELEPILKVVLPWIDMVAYSAVAGFTFGSTLTAMSGS